MSPPSTPTRRNPAAKTPPPKSPSPKSRQVFDGQGGIPGLEPGDATTRLSGLPGFGPRLIERAAAALGSPEAVWAALQAGDVETVGQIPGIGTRLAQRLVQNAHGRDAPAFFATPRAARLFDDFQRRLLKRACTRAGRNRLRLLVPLNDPMERARRLSWCEQAAQEAATLELESARRYLRAIRALPAAQPRFEADVLLLFDTPQELQQARDAGLDKWAPLAHLRTGDLMERVQQANLVLHATNDPGARPHRLEEADHLVTIEATLQAERLAPWGTLKRHRDARSILEAAAALSQLRGRESPSQKAIETLDSSQGEGARLSTGDVESRAQVLLEEELQHCETELSQLTLTGSEFMRALKQDLPASVERAYQHAARRANTRLEQETGLNLDAYTQTTPPRLEERAIRDATANAAQTAARRRLQNEHGLARRLHTLEGAIEEELADHEAFDARQAIGSLWNEQDWTRVEWGDGLLVEDMRPMHIEGTVEGVDYRLGLDAAGQSEDTTVALLTGANSGGKTTLLESLTLVVALAHAGLGVPARRAVIPDLDAVHLYAPTRDRSAGALESMLLELFPLIDHPGRRLVLADELEAITELEAAAEILAELLEGLIAQKTHAVLATHLAPHLVTALNADDRARIRIDGIEATGLDKDGRLQVQRSPRLDHLARSTPELILRRLAAHGPPELAGRFEQLAKRVHQRLAEKRNVENP